MDYSTIISKAAHDIPPSGIRKFFDIAAEMKDCLSLGIGEPDFITAASFSEAGIASIRDGKTQYTSNNGLYGLRVDICKYVHLLGGPKYSPDDETLVTVGASEAIDIALRAVVNPGEEVLIPSPSYVSYAPCVSLTYGIPKPINCLAKNDFKLTAEELENAITPRTKALILPYPNNPTGAIMEREYLEAIAPIIIKHNLVVISDEVYSELTYGDAPHLHVSIANIEGMRERTILISGFSKAFAMTGWRIGYLCAPKELVEIIRKIHQYVIMCAPTASQYAAQTALEESFNTNFKTVREMCDEYNERRVYLVKRLNDMGIECFEPKGAFYAFPSVESTGLNGEEFAERLLLEQKVAVVPGIAFGESGKNHIRISYACSIDTLREALDRMEVFVKSLKA
ncbi:MAG: aminotransferase class I/II-fold pyridoxal phosphate-dependent enzyme [Clostridia bacterium]|nr:aminotransferase class I/II-fold pyridoxal phosphate-dependent enzyme [Clostridia bacterium]